MPYLYRDLTAVSDSYFESRPPPWRTDAPTIELDEMEMNQLRALGYGVQYKALPCNSPKT